MTGVALIVAFVVSIVLMIVAISKWKVHPFLAIMTISLLLGFLAGIPLVDVKQADGKVSLGLASVIGQGFSGTFTSIGIVIILGALIGSILEATGAAIKLADMVVKLVGPNHPELAIEIMGWIVSIPVFCDSGFVILNPIRRAIVQRTRTSSVAMTVALSAGLYASHVFIPPTPGPIAAANTLGIGNNLLLIMGLGALVSIPALIVAYFYAKFIGKRTRSNDEADSPVPDGEIRKTYEEIIAEHGKLPNGFLALAPIIVPILLMAVSSIVSASKGSGTAARIFLFMGTPIIALAMGTVLGVILLAATQTMAKFYGITNETLKTVGPILFITAAGGVLGKVIAASDMVPFIKANATSLSTVGIFFPFLLAAILKTAQGSSTVALVTTAGILAPLMESLGLNTPILTALTVMAIGAGAMTVSHANDSYFWVVTNFGGMQPEQGYKTQTVVTLLEGIVSIIFIFLLTLIFR